MKVLLFAVLIILFFFLVYTSYKMYVKAHQLMYIKKENPEGLIYYLENDCKVETTNSKKGNDGVILSYLDNSTGKIHKIAMSYPVFNLRYIKYKKPNKK